jgi:glycosyltransferase involved in cell wall biosynthesis
LDVCRGYASSDSRFRILTQSRRGLSAARNLGLDAASGEWTYLADADDRLSPVFLEHSLNFADRNNLQAVFWNAGVIDEGAGSTETNSERNWLAMASADCGFCSGEEAFCSMLEASGVFRSAVWFYAIRRDCLKARFIDSLIYAEDHPESAAAGANWMPE